MRNSGILMHLSSLPSRYGIGTLGKEAEKFADFLDRTGTGYWQILPIGPTSYGDSPYQSFSSYAGNPYFIDLEELIEEGLLRETECSAIAWSDREDQVDYETLYQYRFQILYRAYRRFSDDLPEEFFSFCEKEKSWLEDYALFMAEKDDHEGEPWYQWEDELKLREKEMLARERNRLADRIRFYEVLQYWFYRQWEAFRGMLKQKHIRLIGDIPIYMAYDSVEVWCEPELFSLDENLDQVQVAGCPPDAFDAGGQLWGNPIYRWDVMKKDGYAWWMRRLRHTMRFYDKIRIDHFRGFASYFSIPAEDEDATGGKWVKGPGYDFFRTMKRELGEVDIIAEDLGFLTEDVYELMDQCGYPGMKVLQFAFGCDDGQNLYLPHNFTPHSVVYTGTHDNNTSLGWYAECEPWERDHATAYLHLDEEEGIGWGMIRGAMGSVSELAIVPMQDILELGTEARMNRPSTLGGNWCWRMRPDQNDAAVAEKWSTMNRRFARWK